MNESFTTRCPTCKAPLTDQHQPKKGGWSPFEGGGGAVSCANGHRFEVLDREMYDAGVRFALGNEIKA